MDSILQTLQTRFRSAIQSAFQIDADPAVSLSQTDKFGDYQSNAAMGLAKQLKLKPRDVAESILKNLDVKDISNEVPTIAGPGFINIRLSPAWLSEQLKGIQSDPRLGVSPVANPQTVVVDYSGPNIAKQMHVGHLRSTIIGDSIARVLEFQGQKVIRQNHLGDWGTQFGMLISHLRSLNSGGEVHIADLEAFYRDARKRFESEPAFADEARATVVELQSGAEAEKSAWQQIIAESRRHFQPLYDQLGIQLSQTDERGESFYNSMLPSVVSDLKQSGIAKESEGAQAIFTPGFEAPLIIEKSGGGYGYATTDLAAIRFRTGELGAKRIVYFVGNPQSQHFQQVFDAAKKAGWASDVTLEHAGFGSVLGEDGKMFKSRSGDTVKLADLISEAIERAQVVVESKNPSLPEEQKREIARAVGIGAIKYADLSKDRVGDYTFSFDKMLAMEGNTAPYLQYAHARVKSIFRKAGIDPSTISATIKLESPFESSIAKHLLRFGEVVDLVARELKPHHLCTYLYELATKFSSFYENCPVLTSTDEVKASRLAICDLTARTLAKGLDLLGIEHPEQM